MFHFGRVARWNGFDAFIVAIAVIDVLLFLLLGPPHTRRFPTRVRKRGVRRYPSQEAFLNARSRDVLCVCVFEAAQTAK